MSDDKRGAPRMRRLMDAAPPWNRDQEIVAGAMQVGEGGSWDLFLHFIPQTDGRLYLFGLDIRPNNVLFMKSMSELPPGGVTARAIRSIKLGEVLADLRARDRRAVPDSDSHVPADLPEPGSRPGRRGLSDEFIAWVAINYLRAVRRAPSTPIWWMQDKLGNGYPRDTIKGWVVAARKRGFLTPTTQGRAGGEAGPRLPDFVPDWSELDDREARDRLIAIHRLA